jgi:hypothetical protein
MARGDDQVSCEVEGDVVVMDLNRQEFYALNPTASAVWRLLEAPRSVDDVVGGLVDQFRVERERCARETAVLIERLEERRVLRRVPSSDRVDDGVTGQRNSPV